MVQLFVCENKMDCLDLQKYNKNMNFQKYNVLFVGNCQKYFEDVFMDSQNCSGGWNWILSVKLFFLISYFVKCKKSTTFAVRLNDTDYILWNIIVVKYIKSHAEDLKNCYNSKSRKSGESPREGGVCNDCSSS